MEVFFSIPDAQAKLEQWRQGRHGDGGGHLMTSKNSQYLLPRQ